MFIEAVQEVPPIGPQALVIQNACSWHLLAGVQIGTVKNLCGGIDLQVHDGIAQRFCRGPGVFLPGHQNRECVIERRPVLMNPFSVSEAVDEMALRIITRGQMIDGLTHKDLSLMGKLMKVKGAHGLSLPFRA